MISSKYLVLLLFVIAFGFFFFFGITFQIGPGFSSSHSQTEPVQFSFSGLQMISGHFFQGPKDAVLQKYQEFLADTVHGLQVETYEFTYPWFKDIFRSLLVQGKEIQVIVEDDKYQQYSDPMKQLAQDFSGFSQIAFQSDEPMGTTYVHSKIMLNESGAWIQTANLTKSSYESNREHFFFTQDTGIVQNLHELFSGDWNGAPLRASQLHPNLVVCPQNCRTVIESLLREAKESLIIQTQYVLDPVITDILREKSASVRLQVIVADTSDNAEFTAYFGPQVARRLTSRYNHTKMILVDQKYLLLGSMNLSDTSLDKNREIGILLLDPEIIHRFEEGFRVDRESAGR